MSDIEEGKDYGGVNEMGNEERKESERRGWQYWGREIYWSDLAKKKTPSRCSCKGKMKLNTSTPPCVATGPKELNTVWGTADPGRYVMITGDAMGIVRCGPICFCNGGGSPPNGRIIQLAKKTKKHKNEIKNQLQFLKPRIKITI